jgi:L-lactate dehydrogenase
MLYIIGNFSTDAVVRQGAWKDVREANIIVITAGARQSPGETRDELLNRNRIIFESICSQLLPVPDSTIIVIVANPVDVLTGLFQRLSGLPTNRVIGSGTFLDSMRFRRAISEYTHVSPSNIHALVIGEHGDAQVPVISSIHLSGVPIELCFPELSQSKLRELATATRQRAYEIISAKGVCVIETNCVNNKYFSQDLRIMELVFVCPRYALLF